VKDEEIRIAVLKPAISFGRCSPGAGHGAPSTTRMKK